MYSIHEHIEAARKKEEWWSVEHMELVVADVEKHHPFGIDANTLETLNILWSLTKIKRDSFEKFSVDFQTEWSKLTIIDNIRMLVKNAIGDEYEEHF